MRRRRELGQPADIAFLLIIFFLLLAGITASHSLTLSVHPPGTQENQEVQELFLTLLSDGTVRIEGKAVLPGDLRRLITPSTQVTISIEGSVGWQEVIDLFSLIENSPAASLALELLP